MTTATKNIMNCDVILTFDKLYDNDKQAYLNFDIEIEQADTDLCNFISAKLFKEIAKYFECKQFVFEKEWLATVSTSCDWEVYKQVTGNNDLTELDNGKWGFAECASHKLISDTLTYKIKYEYGFGTHTDSSWFWDNIDNGKGNTAYVKYLLANS